MNIGIEDDTKLIYEASSQYGHPIWPSPVMLQVVIASEEDKEYTAAKHRDLGPNTIIFREETYNSSSRVRRGRLYKAGNGQPVQWYVYPHPALPYETNAAIHKRGTLAKQIFAFSSFRLNPYLKQEKIHRPVFILGAEDNFTIWTLVNTETSATGEELVVLRARKSIGALPHLNTRKILDADGRAAIELIEKLEEELYRAGPESIIDRTREAATAILSKFLQINEVAKPGKDIGRLANAAAESGFEIVANAARVIARLHARGKHAEQEQRPIRPITEQDAEFAVQAVGTILCDLGWARW
ncbi:hypothetical protein [Thiohalophilus sp.]|uniref:hypothetical protein n=1 Tax=Thiohalophilus sp. TaxID=3028392 RepID=UPI002ACE635F|nr:hypothetical protein [Thiohalophilus sp.]MDZ7663002.1 hypothetical protein [Thiohalophilus sp.]